MSLGLEVQKQRFNSLLENTRAALVVVVVNSAIYSYLSWNIVDHNILIGWLIAVYCTTLFRAIMHKNISARVAEATNVADLHRQGRYFITGVLASGFIWGAMGWPLMQIDNSGHVSITCIILAGMAAGSVHAYGSVFRAIVCFSFPALVPTAIHLMTTGSEMDIGTGVLIFIYLMSITKFAKSGQERNIRTLVLSEENKVLNEAARDREKSLIKSIDAKTSFLRTISHEVRTPLNGIIGLTEDLEDKATEPENKAKFKMIKNLGGLLLSVIGDILEYSKLSSNEIQLKESDFDIDELANELECMFAKDVKDKNLSFKVSVKDFPHYSVKSDPSKIQKVLTYLVNNSVKFTHEGSITLEIALIPDRTEMAFTVTDSGIGIEQTKIDQIFEPFSQVDGSITRRYGGTGLGLSICDKLVKILEGKFEIESEVGRGTTITVRIPYQEGTKQSPTTVGASASDFSSSNILVVEDDDINQMVLRKKLQKHGCQVTVASNGKEALALVKETQFDLIFMDCQMPIMDGYEATRQIRKLDLTSQPIIVALTAHSVEKERDNCISAGMNDFMTKPVRKEKLSSMLEKHLASDKLDLAS